MKEIIKQYDDKIAELEEGLSNLRKKRSFCIEHKLDEEARILSVKIEYMEIPLYYLRKLMNDIKTHEK